MNDPVPLITSVSILPVRAPGMLLAYCSIILDRAVLMRDLKIIRGRDRLFVSMPARQLEVRCPHCPHKNQVRAAFCQYCGTRLDPAALFDSMRREKPDAKRWCDLVHPIEWEWREYMERVVITAYHEAVLKLEADPHWTPNYHRPEDAFATLTTIDDSISTSSSAAVPLGSIGVECDDHRPDETGTHHHERPSTIVSDR